MSQCLLSRRPLEIGLLGRICTNNIFLKLVCFRHIKQNTLTFLSWICTPYLSESPVIFGWAWLHLNWVSRMKFFSEKATSEKKPFICPKSFQIRTKWLISGLSRDAHAQKIAERIFVELYSDQVCEELSEMHEKMFHPDGPRTPSRSAPSCQTLRMSKLLEELPFASRLLQRRLLPKKCSARFPSFSLNFENGQNPPH